MRNMIKRCDNLYKNKHIFFRDYCKWTATVYDTNRPNCMVRKLFAVIR